MGIPVKLQVFEGPLDLLLHLIEKNKIDIYDIPIVEITNQYMEYIKAMQKEDLNIMSEFLVMAATLLDIKCNSRSNGPSNTCNFTGIPIHILHYHNLIIIQDIWKLLKSLSFISG